MDIAPQAAAVRAKSVLPLVAFIVFIDMVGLALIVPVMPALLRDLTGAPIDRAAEIGGWLLFAYAVMQFLFAPVIGGLSDRFGRRPVLLATLALLGIDYAIMAVAPDLWWLFIGRLLSGVMGASWAAANSCVADLAGPRERGRLFGILGAAGASGFVIGPAIGGLLGSADPRLPFFAASALAVGGATIGLFTLGETLPPERRRTLSWVRANPLGTVVQMARDPVVLGLLGVIVLLQLAAQAQISVWAYYNTLQFGWSTLQIGLSIALFGTLLAITQGGLVGPVIRRIGPARTGLIGMMTAIPTYLIFAFADSGWMMVLGIVIGMGGGLGFPAMQQIMSERIPEDAQGELQGAVASAISMTSIVGPLIMTGLFGTFADRQGLYFPGAPFLLAALLAASALTLYAATIGRLPSPRREDG